MTTTLYLLIWVAVALSLAHHADHILRGDTGWPFSDQVNTFSYSLVIYPIILTGLVLSLFGLVGPRFWAFISLGGAAFVAAVHLGPVSTDAITAIPGQYPSPIAGALAVLVLVALVAVLVGTFGYEARLASKSRRRNAERQRISLRQWLAENRKLLAFIGLAYAFSWAFWVPLTLSGTVIDFGSAAPLWMSPGSSVRPSPLSW